MPVIQLTQVKNKHELKDITTLIVDFEFERINRIFPVKADRDEPLQVWIDRMSDNGYDLVGDPIAITASQAQWFLKEYCRRPKSEWSKVIQAN